MTQTMTKTTTPALRRKTPFQEQRAARDLAVYREFKSLVSVEGQSRTEVVRYLMNKHDIHSTATLYEILKRMENRQEAAAAGKEGQP